MFLDIATANQLHFLAGASLRTMKPKDWRQYLGFAQELPALLRENGLQQTLDFLRHQATKKPAAAQLLEDWLGHGGQHLRLAGVLAVGTGAQQLDRAPRIQAAARVAIARRTHGDYLLASQLAMAEAQRIKRSAEAVDARKATSGSPTPDSHAAKCWPAPSDLMVGPPALFGPPMQAADEDLRQHPGLVWRYGGMPAQFLAATRSAEGAGAANPWARQQFKTSHRDQALAVAIKWRSSDHGKLYEAAFRRWENWVRKHCECCNARVQTRLLIGLGAPSVFETQILLHPVYGLPYLPGSTLKGALKAWLGAKINTLKQQATDDKSKANTAALQETHDALFGLVREAQDKPRQDAADEPPGQAGLLRLHDAWWVPGNASPLVAEVETPHHSGYYSGERDVASVFDSPTPVAQLAVQGEFLLAIDHAGAGEDWAKKMLEYLVQALGDPQLGGLGGKTYSAGYGRLVATEPVRRNNAAAPGGGKRKKSKKPIPQA